MQSMSEKPHPTRLAPCRLLGAIVLVAASVILAPHHAKGQTAVDDDIVAEMAAQQKLISVFRARDYQIREHFLLEANAILSTYGGWNSIDRLGNNAYKFRSGKTDFEEQVVFLRRDIGRASAITEDELLRFNNALQSYVDLIETGARIADAVVDGRVDASNQIYFETARPKYLTVHGELYTLIVTAERRVAAMARKRRN